MSTFKIEGLNDLQRVFDELGGARSRVVFREGAHKTAGEILAESQRNLTANDSHMGKLFKSGKYKYSNEEGIGAEAYYDADYAIYLEFGRRAGKGLNEEGVKAVAQWAIKKGILHSYNIKTRKRSTAGAKDIEERARSFAIFYSGRLKRRGRKAKPFLFPAFEAKKGNLWRNISEAYQKMIDTIKV